MRVKGHGRDGWAAVRRTGSGRLVGWLTMAALVVGPLYAVRTDPFCPSTCSDALLVRTVVAAPATDPNRDVVLPT
jgi:hypothetical protein